MKSFVLVTFLFFLTFSFGQAKDSIVLKVYLEDAYTNKNIKDGKVTLEGFEIPALMSKYDKKGEFYYFTEIPNGYKAIFVNQKKYDESGVQFLESIPSKISLNLNCKGNIVETDTMYKEIPVKVASSKNAVVYKQKAEKIIKTISTRDEYKIFISLKNSSTMSYKEIRKKIDSIVVPLGLEYIENLQPKVYFMNIFQYCDQNLKEECVDNFYSRPITTYLNEDLPIKVALKEDYFDDLWFNFIDKYTFFGMYDGLKIVNWNKNCYVLPYRKKDFNKIRLFNDYLVETIKGKTDMLTFFSLRYTKFVIEEQLNLESKDENLNYIGKIDCKFLSSFDDKLLNFQFISNTPEEISRTFYLDYSLKNTYVNKYGLYNNTTGNHYRFLHEYSLKKSNADDPIFKNYRNKGLFFNSSLVLVNY